jgi:hypothetical protein
VKKANQPLPYTEGAPVLTEKMLWRWRRAGGETVQWNVGVSREPSILGPDLVEPDGLRIWRKGLSPAVADFTAAILEVGGAGIPRDMQRYFKTASYLAIDADGQLQGFDVAGQEIDVSPDSVIRALRGLPVDRGLVEAFADDICERLMMALSEMPYDVYLSYDDWSKADYSRTPRFTHNEHSDGFDNLLLHYSRPGSPYLLKHGIFRSDEGDVTYHGKGLRHGHSTAPPMKDGTNRPRLCFGFVVVGRDVA